MGKVWGFLWRRKRLLAIALVVVAILFFVFRSRNGHEEFEEAVVERGMVTEELILSGEVVADEHAQLAFPTSGKISWISVSEGDVVAKGQALAKLDTVALNSSLQRARADYRAAEANAQEVLDDVKGNDSDETFSEKNNRTAAEVARDKAYEAVVVAEQNLRDSTLVSPFDGIVAFIENPFVGVNVLATQIQVEVVNPETIHFQVAADQTEVTNIMPGDRVNIVLDALDEVELKGTVRSVSFTTIATEIGSVYKVRVDFDVIVNGSFVYRVGMTGDAHFVLAQKENVVYVPSNFVKSDSDGEYVLINEGKEKRYIEIGLEGEERTEVISGIEEGVRIYD